LVDPEVFDRRLAKLEQVVVDLRSIASTDEAVFLADRGLQAQAERWVQVAVEACLDLSHHLIADRGWRTPTSYRDAFDVLAERDVIDAPLAGRLAGWAGLRNIVVHMYLEIDHARVLAILRDDLDDLVGFAVALGRVADPG
jgi:uncharacterized protein YutE (UPF0331/DUF86 family)